MQTHHDVTFPLVVMGVFIAYIIGAGFLPTLLGIFGDRGAFAAAFILVGSLMLLSVLLLPRLVLTEGKKTGLKEFKN